MPNLSSFVRVSLILLCLFLPGSVFAETAFKKPLYLIDIRINECKAFGKAEGSSVLFYTNTEGWWCQSGDAPIEQLRADGLAGCEGNIRHALRAVSQCVIVLENGKIKNAAFVAKFRREARSPVTLEVFDASTRQTAVEKGFIATGRLLSENVQEIRLIRAEGKSDCVGTINAPNQDFLIRCDDILFKGRPTVVKGSFFYEDQFRLAFNVTFRYKGGTLKVKTIIPKGTKLYLVW